MRGAAHPSTGTPGNWFLTTRAWEVGPDNFYALMEVTVGQIVTEKSLWVAGSQVLRSWRWLGVEKFRLLWGSAGHRS